MPSSSILGRGGEGSKAESLKGREKGEEGTFLTNIHFSLLCHACCARYNVVFCIQIDLCSKKILHSLTCTVFAFLVCREYSHTFDIDGTAIHNNTQQYTTIHSNTHVICINIGHLV